MKHSLAYTFLLASLILSSIAFLLSLAAFYLPNWKTIEYRSTPSASTESDLDPLIRGEVEKYNDLLYRQGATHTFGLSSHCILDGSCGRNLLPAFNQSNYRFCHNVKYHHQCIFTDSSVLPSKKCSCEKPYYVRVTFVLFLLIFVLQILFLLAHCLRLYRPSYLNDIQLRLFAMVSALFSSVFLLVILIQQRTNRFHEPLEFFQAMRQYYSQEQIYSFSKDLERIIEQMEQKLDVHFGVSYAAVIIVLILTIISFFITSTIDMESLTPSVGGNNNDDDDEEKATYSRRSSSADRFVPSEHIRFTRQTKV